MYKIILTALIFAQISAFGQKKLIIPILKREIIFFTKLEQKLHLLVNA